MIRLSEATLGTVVCYSDQYTDRNSVWAGVGIYPRVVGHVVGFCLNCTNEVLVKVKLCTGAERDFHPANLDIYTGE